MTKCINDELAEIKAEIKMLDKLCSKAIDALAAARVAEKTADKALAMAQECLALQIASQTERGSEAPPYGGEDFMGAYPEVTGPFSPRPEPKTPTDEELSKALNGDEEQIDVDS